MWHIFYQILCRGVKYFRRMSSYLYAAGRGDGIHADIARYRRAQKEKIARCRVRSPVLLPVYGHRSMSRSPRAAQSESRLRADGVPLPLSRDCLFSECGKECHHAG